MKFSIAIFALLTAGFVQTAVGISCGSKCAACWLDNNSDGVDTKFSCNGSDCGDNCPAGYSGIHCADSARCNCQRSDRGYPDGCYEFGPCACGQQDPNEYQSYCNGPCF